MSCIYQWHACCCRCVPDEKCVSAHAPTTKDEEQTTLVFDVSTRRKCVATTVCLQKACACLSCVCACVCGCVCALHRCSHTLGLHSYGWLLRCAVVSHLLRVISCETLYINSVSSSWLCCRNKMAPDIDWGWEDKSNYNYSTILMKLLRKHLMLL